VIEGDLDRHAFEQKTLAFATAPGSDAGVFFCPGHGMGSPTKLPRRQQPSTGLTSRGASWNAAPTPTSNSDAVRANPLACAISRSMGTRSPEIGRRLATLETGIGTLIRFSTQPGNVALDGTGRDSPFAGAWSSRWDHRMVV